MITKQSLKEILKNNIVDVCFTKVDGSKRQMKCTLKEDILPVYQATINSKKEENEGVLPVWDIEKNSFRSFRLDCLLSYTIST